VKRLVVTADDFGAAREVNDAVLEAHTRGILTATSLMVAAEAAGDAVARAKATPSLRVGLHIVLTDGKPMLPPDAIPDLVDASGWFRNDMVRSATAMFFRPSVRSQLAHEIEAQFEAFRATGLRLDHVNTHKHFHLHPTIASTILRIGRRFGMRAMRVPLEPREVLAAAEPGCERSPAYVTDPWARLSRRNLRKAGLLTPDYVFGLAWSGAMTAPRLKGLIEHLPEGLSEIYLHPATAGGFSGAAPGYRYAEEFAALTHASVVTAAREAGVRLGGFVDF
jgi:hopanoid biosynthesis associated protein HpnK